MSPNNRLLDEIDVSPNIGTSIVQGNGHAPRSSGEAGFSMSDLAFSTVRHKWKVLCFCCGTILLAVVAAIYWPKTYRSQAKLYLKIGRQSVGNDPTTNLNRGTVAIQMTREEEMNTVVDLLRSQSMLEKVVDAVGADIILNPEQDTQAANSPSWFSRISSTLQEWKNGLTKDVPLSPRERAIDTLKAQLDVQNVRKADVINITHDGRNAEISQRIVRSLIDLYLDQHLQLNRSPGAQACLTGEAAAMKSELAQAEEALRVFKNESGLTSPAEQRVALVNEIAHLEQELGTASASAAAAEAENRELSRELASVSPVEQLGTSTGNPNFAADGMRQQLYALQLKEKELASRVTEQHFDLRSIRAQISAATPIVDSLEPSRTQKTTGRNRIHEELRLTVLRQVAVVAAQRARTSVLQNLLKEANRRLRVLNDNEIQITQLQRDAQILDASYRRYADSREQARLEGSLDRQKISNMVVAQPPTLSFQMIRPQRSLILAAGLLFALIGAPCIAMASEYFETTRKASEHVARPCRRAIPATASS